MNKSKLEEAVGNIAFEDNDHGCFIALRDYPEVMKQIMALYTQTFNEWCNKIRKMKRKQGKHDGHSNDDRSWCYDCQESATEEEFTNNWLYNQAIDDVLQHLAQKREER